MRKFMRRYKKYPKFIRQMFNRPKEYNDTIELISDLEKKKKIFVIRPSVDINVDAIKKTKEDLQRVYDVGFNDMKKSFKDLTKYLS